MSKYKMTLERFSKVMFSKIYHKIAVINYAYLSYIFLNTTLFKYILVLLYFQYFLTILSAKVMNFLSKHKKPSYFAVRR